MPRTSTSLSQIAYIPKEDGCSSVILIQGYSLAKILWDPSVTVMIVMHVQQCFPRFNLGTRMTEGGAAETPATHSAQNELISSNLGRIFCSTTSEDSVRVSSTFALGVGTQTCPLKLEVFDEEWNSFNERIDIANKVL